MNVMNSSFSKLAGQVCRCGRCPRLVAWREKVAKEKVRRYSGHEYWGKAVPGFGDPHARLWIVGLAPGAHGANRTGRLFTGDRSGEWLYRALFKAGFANQPQSVSRDDGLVLTDCYISAVIRCAPPANKPEPSEIKSCRTFLEFEIRLLRNLRVIMALGQIAHQQVLKLLQDSALYDVSRRIRFGHGVATPVGQDVTLIDSYHPSQQNTFTGRLTKKMLDDVFAQARGTIRKRK